jgi:hypothetical protein
MIKKIAHLKKLVLENIHHESQLKLISEIIHGVPVTAMDVLNKHIYRARWSPPKSLFNHFNDLIYPPTIKAEKSRFNKQGESVLYAAACELGAITELRPDINKFFTITKFHQISNDFPFFFPLGMNDRYSPKCKLNKSQKIVHDFLVSEVTKEVIFKEGYNITNLMADIFLYKTINIPGKNFPYGGITYSSVQSKLISNTETYNFVMTPKFYHTHYSISDTTMYVLLHEYSKYWLLPINTGIISTSGAISWKYSFDEMKSRVSQGILLDNSVRRGIRAMVNFL